jgi:hypothetical protein
MIRVQSRVKVGKRRIACDTKDARDEIQVAHTTTGNKESNLTALFLNESRYFGTNKRTKLERNERLDGLLPLGSVRKHIQFRGGLEGRLEKASVGDERNGNFVSRNRKPIIRHVKDSFCCALVVKWIMEHSILCQPVRGDFRILKLIATLRERKLSGKSISINSQRIGREQDALFRGKHVVQKVLNTLVDRAQVRL